MSLIYSIPDINKIMFDGFSYRLPEQNMKIISELEKLMGSELPTQVKPKTYDKKITKNVASSNSNNDDEWTVIRTSFKPTKLDVKEGIENDVNIIRSSLNKISNKNFELQSNLIIDYIKAFLKKQILDEIPKEDQLKNIKRIGDSIFDIANTNKNNSELYALLYKELIKNFDFFNDMLTAFVGNFKNTIQNIHYVDPATNYDQFCAYTKINDSRKSTTLFLVNLMKLDLIPVNNLIDIIQYFQETVIQYIDQSNRKNETEEIVENIFIFVSQGFRFFNKTEQWEMIMSNIQSISIMKIKDHLSLTNRTVFKCLDTLESL